MGMEGMGWEKSAEKEEGKVGGGRQVGREGWKRGMCAAWFQFRHATVYCQPCEIGCHVTCDISHSCRRVFVTLS